MHSRQIYSIAAIFLICFLFCILMKKCPEIPPTKIKEQDENNFIFTRLITCRMSQDLSSVAAEKCPLECCYFSPNKAPVGGPRNDQHDSTRTIMDNRLFVIIWQLIVTIALHCTWVCRHGNKFHYTDKIYVCITLTCNVIKCYMLELNIQHTFF